MKNTFKRRNEERKVRGGSLEKLRSPKWLIICEGVQTEVNYFNEVIKYINARLDSKSQLKVKIVGKGMNTTSLVRSVDDILNYIDGCRNSFVPYDKIFVVFDKDCYDSKMFDEAIRMCEVRGYIPLWSNEAIEFWFLLHFCYLNAGIDRSLYEKKLNDCFKNKGLNYKYQKNDKEIYSKLIKYGSIDKARTNAKKIHLENTNLLPSQAVSCTTIYEFFEEIDKLLEELK